MHPPVGDFIDAIFGQLREGRQELTWGFSELAHKAGPEQRAEMFGR